MTGRYRDAGALLPPLVARVPALLSALDAKLAARHVEEMLLQPGGQVHQVIPGALWYRPDGSCSLRYQVTVSAGTSGAAEHTVLARVKSDSAAEAPVTDPPFPWRRWTAAPGADGTSLHLFPADPALPTLAAAMDLAALSSRGWPCTTVDPASVDLVHHSRQGPAVLRYGVRRPGSSAASLSGHVYGKVYPDGTTGPRVHGFLRSCPRPGHVRVPKSLGYSPGLSLGLTEALPGRPLLPGIVRSAARVGSGGSTAGSAHETVRAAGQALAGLHSIRHATAPELTVSQLTDELHLQLNVVQPVWPDLADEVRSRLDRLGLTDRVGTDGAAAVLSHGDFTPSQVLFSGDAVCGVVDFDTVCWSEETMDLGRFLAHLDLAVAKDTGRSADQLRDQLADSFVSGYAESAGVPVTDESFLERVALFRSLSLASTALHACRQLKERRVNLALSLLSLPINPAHSRIGKAHS